MSHPLIEQLKQLNREELLNLFDVIGQWQELTDEEKAKFKEKLPYLAETLHNLSHVFKVKHAKPD